MQVKCTKENDNPWVFASKHSVRFFGFIVGKKDVKATGPKKDEICTVVSKHYSEGLLFYVLREWPKNNGGGFDAAWFIPIEETFEAVTFKEIKEKASVN